MSAKFKGTKLVYSTNPDFNQWDDNEQMDELVTLPPQKQKLTISLDKKQRKGKKVTLVSGFVGNNDDLKNLAKLLKSKCGVGGTAKNNEIIIQGDFKEKIAQLLTQMNYKTKISGG